MNNSAKFTEFRSKYSEFIYKSYLLTETDQTLKITYEFEIKDLVIFHPSIVIAKKDISGVVIDDAFFHDLVFNLGMIEALSYYKCTCSPKFIVEAGYLSVEQIKWWKKLYLDGLGEFFYRNGITTSINDLVSIVISGKPSEREKIIYKGEGNLIPVGGGKDSLVTLEILRDLKAKNTPFVINPKDVHFKCLEDDYSNKGIFIQRNLDQKLLALNEKGFLNGHTPFSAIIAFTSYLVAYLTKKKNIILSNEASANEPTVLKTNINHQYSKSYEFEKDFNDYTAKYFQADIKYFSLLRGLNETQIAFMFSHYKKYHNCFCSCNLGSKNNPWTWCNNCPKCLFSYIILSQFLDKAEILTIFKEDLYTKSSLLETFKQLIGETEAKPFECVGTIEEVKNALSNQIRKTLGDLPVLLKYYQTNYSLTDDDLLNEYNQENNLDQEFEQLVRNELNKHVSKHN